MRTGPPRSTYHEAARGKSNHFQAVQGCRRAVERRFPLFCTALCGAARCGATDVLPTDSLLTCLLRGLPSSETRVGVRWCRDRECGESEALQDMPAPLK